jgi:hypothetical protein
MSTRRRGPFHFCSLLLIAALSGCPRSSPGPSTSTQNPADRDAAVYESCSGLCLRPGDCEVAYNDDGICPIGFKCALRFPCSPSPSP